MADGYQQDLKKKRNENIVRGILEADLENWITTWSK